MEVAQAYEVLSDEDKRKEYDSSAGGSGRQREKARSEQGPQPVDLWLK